MRKILVVDDKPNVQTTLRIGLSREGYVVDIAGDALKAMTKIQQDDYDVLLSDVRMPIMDGFILASTVIAINPNIHIVLMSAYDFKEYEEKYKDLDHFPKLSKPFELKELLDILNSWFENEKLSNEYTGATIAGA